MRSTTSSRRARGAKHSRWLLVRGRGEKPLDARVTEETLQAHSSTRRPAIARGDLAVCYASVWQALFAVVEVVSELEHDPSRDRWAWRFRIRPRTFVPDLHRAPAVEEAGIFPLSIWRHSYIRVTDEQFERAVELVESAAQ